MINVKTEYTRQMNGFCDANCKTTAEDILKMAKERMTDNSDGIGDVFAKAGNADNMGNVVSISEHKRKKKIWKALIPAACFLLISTTALATTGHLSTLFRNIFKDETTAEIVEQGYLYEVGQSKTEGIFQVDFVAVTGDAQTPKLVFDVYVHDEELAANNDRIYMLAYTLGMEQYENELDSYAPSEAYGEKDAEIDNLYHVSMTGAPVWMTSGESVVVDVCQIQFDLEQENPATYELNMEYRFTPPSDVYYPVSDVYYEDIMFSHGGIDYYLQTGLYGPYRSELIFHFDYEGAIAVEEQTDYTELEGELQAKWLDFIETVTLVVDGEEYRVDDIEKGYIWCDVEGEVFEKNHCSVCPYFPSVNYEEANSVVIKAGDKSYILK